MKKNNKQKQILNISKKSVSKGWSSEGELLIKPRFKRTKLKNPYRVFYLRPPVPPKE